MILILAPIAFCTGAVLDLFAKCALPNRKVWILSTFLIALTAEILAFEMLNQYLEFFGPISNEIYAWRTIHLTNTSNTAEFYKRYCR